MYVRLKKTLFVKYGLSGFCIHKNNLDDVNEEQRSPKKVHGAAKNEKPVTEGNEKPESRK